MNGSATQRGVSLVELLVSLLLVGLLSTALHQLARGLFFGVRVLEVASEAQEAARLGVHIMARDLRGAGFSADRRLGNGIRLATPTAVRIVTDLNGDGDTADANEDIGYSFDSATRTLRRSSGSAAPQPLLSDLAAGGLLLTYFDDAGAPVAVAADGSGSERVRRIDITVRIAIAHPDPTYQTPLRATETASVVVRNR